MTKKEIKNFNVRSLEMSLDNAINFLNQLKRMSDSLNSKENISNITNLQIMLKKDSFLEEIIKASNISKLKHSFRYRFILNKSMILVNKIETNFFINQLAYDSILSSLKDLRNNVEKIVVLE